MPTKKFPKRELQDLLSYDNDDLLLIDDRMIGQGRWSIDHELIFKDTRDRKIYAVAYSEGATEQQPERPFEYDPDEIECTEMVEREVMRLEYVPA